jgi:hypothetical protein
MKRKYLTEWKRFLNENTNIETTAEYIKTKIISLGMEIVDTKEEEEDGYYKFMFYINNPDMDPKKDLPRRTMYGDKVSKESRARSAAVKVEFQGGADQGDTYYMLGVDGDETHMPKFTSTGDYGWNTKGGQIEGLPKFIRTYGETGLSNSQIDTFLTQVKTAVIDNVKSDKEKRQVRRAEKQVDRKGYPAYYNKQDKKG